MLCANFYNSKFGHTKFCRDAIFLLLSPVQTDATLLANNSQHCWMSHVASVCRPCCMLLDVAAHAHYAWFTKTYGLYPSHDALQVPTLLGVVASVCTPLPTRTQQLATMFGVVASVCTQPFTSNGIDRGLYNHVNGKSWQSLICTT